MNQRLLGLHFSQLTRAWNKSKYNNYSDKRKQAYHDKLRDIYAILKKEDFLKYNPAQVSERYRVIDFIFKSLEFLDNSTLNVMPFEIVECLGSALKDWTPSNEEYLIVTSLVNGINDFSFNPSLATNNQLYDNIKILYNIEFDSKLIQINVPQYLSRDYMANVVLYHELGHFVDTKYQISSAIYWALVDEFYVQKNITGADKNDLLHYFPYLEDADNWCLHVNGKDILSLYYHIGEYLCDLFASQYIGECSNYYLGYITEMNKNYTQSHPSTESRVELVQRFLKGDTTSFTLNKIVEAVKKINPGKALDIKYQPFLSDDFINLIPTDISNEKQLHYLFQYGWDIWLNNWSKFKKTNNMAFELDHEKVYEVINNLIEKSIGNYVVQTTWTKAKNNVSS